MKLAAFLFQGGSAQSFCYHIRGIFVAMLCFIGAIGDSRTRSEFWKGRTQVSYNFVARAFAKSTVEQSSYGPSVMGAGCKFSTTHTFIQNAALSGYT